MWGDNTIEQNLSIWDRSHPWTMHGDEWRGQARRCGKDYDSWKRSVVARLIEPHARDAEVLEIGPGHGRWSCELARLCRDLWLVDLSPSCLDACRQRLGPQSRVSYWLTDGLTLPPEASGRVGFVWSYDACVHMSAEVIASYLAEIARVLRPGGRATIHHPGRRHATLRLGGLRRLGASGRLAYRWLSMGVDERDDGWRSNVSGALVRRAATRAGLRVERQFNGWGDGCGVPGYRDLLTTVRKL